MPTPIRSALSGALKVALAAGILFVLLEVSARVYFFGLDGLVPERINSVHRLMATGFVRASPVPGLRYELRPDVSGWFKLAPFRTNAAGMRDRAYPRSKPEKTFRVAVVGSSFSLPAGVAIEHAFHSLLEERLSSEAMRVEFLNFAVGGYHPGQIVTMLEERALDYEPDLILFTVTEMGGKWLLGNASKEPDSKRPKPRPMTFRKTHPVLRSFFVQLVRMRVDPEEDVDSPSVGIVEKLYIDALESLAAARDSSAVPDPVPGARPVRVRAPAIERLAEVGRREGLPIIVAFLEINAMQKSTLDRKLEKRVRALGMHFVGTRRAFKGTSPSDFWIYELDPHPNGEAHEIFAGAIDTFLRENDLVPTR